MPAFTPNEAIEAFHNKIPEEVLECWNETIVSNLKLTSNEVKSVCFLKDISAKIQTRMGITSSELEKRGWLNLESFFEKKGWKVSIDKPGYNESYSTTITFSAKK